MVFLMAVGAQTIESSAPPTTTMSLRRRNQVEAIVRDRLASTEDVYVLRSSWHQNGACPEPLVAVIARNDEARSRAPGSSSQTSPAFQPSSGERSDAVEPGRLDDLGLPLSVSPPEQRPMPSRTEPHLLFLAAFLKRGATLVVNARKVFSSSWVNPRTPCWPETDR